MRTAIEGWCVRYPNFVVYKVIGGEELNSKPYRGQEKQHKPLYQHSVIETSCGKYPRVQLLLIFLVKNPTDVSLVDGLAAVE